MLNRWRFREHINNSDWHIINNGVAGARVDVGWGGVGWEMFFSSSFVVSLYVLLNSRLMEEIWIYTERYDAANRRLGETLSLRHNFTNQYNSWCWMKWSAQYYSQRRRRENLFHDQESSSLPFSFLLLPSPPRSLLHLYPRGPSSCVSLPSYIHRFLSLPLSLLSLSLSVFLSSFRLQLSHPEYKINSYHYTASQSCFP